MDTLRFRPTVRQSVDDVRHAQSGLLGLNWLQTLDAMVAKFAAASEQRNTVASNMKHFRNESRLTQAGSGLRIHSNRLDPDH